MRKLFLLPVILVLIVMGSCEPREMRAEKLIREGIHYNYLAKYDEAMECFEKAAHLQPHLAEPPYHIANIHITQRNFEEALSYLNLAIDLDSTYGLAYANRARVIFVITGDRLQACPDWKKAHLLGVPSLYDEVKHCPGGMELFRL